MISPIIIPKHTTAPTARPLNEKGYKDAFYQNCLSIVHTYWFGILDCKNQQISLNAVIVICDCGTCMSRSRNNL